MEKKSMVEELKSIHDDAFEEKIKDFSEVEDKVDKDAFENYDEKESALAHCIIDRLAGQGLIKDIEKIRHVLTPEAIKKLPEYYKREPYNIAEALARNGIGTLEDFEALMKKETIELIPEKWNYRKTARKTVERIKEIISER